MQWTVDAWKRQDVVRRIHRCRPILPHFRKTLTMPYYKQTGHSVTVRRIDFWLISGKPHSVLIHTSSALATTRTFKSWIQLRWKSWSVWALMSLPTGSAHCMSCSPKRILVRWWDLNTSDIPCLRRQFSALLNLLFLLSSFPDDVILALTINGTVKVWTINEMEFKSREPHYENESKQIRVKNASALVCCKYNNRTVLIVSSKSWQVRSYPYRIQLMLAFQWTSVFLLDLWCWRLHGFNRIDSARKGEMAGRRIFEPWSRDLLDDERKSIFIPTAKSVSEAKWIIN